MNGVSTPPTAAQQAIVNNIIAADVPLFHNVDLGTKREAIDGGFSYDIDRNWAVKVSARTRTRTALKPLGTVTLAGERIRGDHPGPDRPDHRPVQR